MRVRAVAALVLALAAACAGPRPAPPRALRLATWNVQNLFDEVDDGAPQETVPEPDAVDAKLARLAAVMQAMGADVVALQEVEHAAVLRRLASAAGGRWSSCLVDGPDPRGIDVAVLSRAPITRCRAHREDGALFSRPPLEVEIAWGERRLVVVVAHLVSKLDPASDGRRATQAGRLRALADRLRSATPGALVVVAGDLNDEPRSAPLAPLLADGAWVDAGAAASLDTTWTYRHAGRRERIDYLVLPREAPARVRSVEAFALRGVRSASDHRPLVADLSW